MNGLIIDMIDVTELIAKGRIQDILHMRRKHLGADAVCQQTIFQSKLFQCAKCGKQYLANDKNWNDFVCTCGSTTVGMEKKTNLISDVLNNKVDWFSLEQSFNLGGVKRLRDNIKFFTELTYPEFRWMYRKFFFKELNFDVLEGYTGPLHILFDGISDKVDFTTMKQTIWKNLVEYVIIQLENNGSTLKFDVDLFPIHPDITLRILPLLIKRRKEEIENLHVDLHSDSVDVTPLKTTHYGMMMLLAVTNRLPDSLGRRHVQVIKQKLQDAGFEIQW